MARFILLEFDNDAQAEAYVEKIINQTNKGKSYRVRGFFAKPRKYCECGAMSELEQKQETRRGDKFGWFVHTKCRRARGITQSPRNLIDPEDTPANMTKVFLRLTETGSILPNYPIQVEK